MTPVSAEDDRPDDGGRCCCCCWEEDARVRGEGETEREGEGDLFSMTVAGTAVTSEDTADRSAPVMEEERPG